MKIEIVEENIGEHNQEKEDTGTEVKSFFFIGNRNSSVITSF